MYVHRRQGKHILQKLAMLVLPMVMMEAYRTPTRLCNESRHTEYTSSAVGYHLNPFNDAHLRLVLMDEKGLFLMSAHCCQPSNDVLVLIKDPTEWQHHPGSQVSSSRRYNCLPDRSNTLQIETGSRSLTAYSQKYLAQTALAPDWSHGLEPDRYCKRNIKQS